MTSDKSGAAGDENSHRSDSTREMASRERRANDRSGRPGRNGLASLERVEKRAIACSQLRDGIAANVEEQTVNAHPATPEARDELGGFQRTRMQQPIAARAVGRDRK